MEKDSKEKKIKKGTIKKYIEGVGRRKTATARVRLYEGRGESLINDKPINQYFTIERFQKTVLDPIKLLKIKNIYFTAKVKGGGIMAQAEAIRHGLSRALVKFNESFKKLLRGAGFLTRDSRMVERKKYGLKKARRAPQWQKR
jgi:small subunit ribosomal protein S9